MTIHIDKIFGGDELSESATLRASCVLTARFTPRASRSKIFSFRGRKTI
jgi:hypothetical protein